MVYLENGAKLNKKEAGSKAEFGMENSVCVSFSIFGKRFHFCKKD